MGQHTPTNADEARRILASANGGACRFVFMGTAGAQDQDIFARDEQARISTLDRPQARAAQARRATPVLLVPEGPLTLQDDGTAAEQADLRYLWQGHETPSEISRDSSGSGGPRQDSVNYNPNPNPNPNLTLTLTLTLTLGRTRGAWWKSRSTA